MTENAARTLYLEDVAAGDRYTSREYPLDAAQIKDFARAFDPQPFHLDEAAAEATFFQGLAASGWHTAAIAMRLMVESVPFSGGLIGASVEISWPRPTRPGDRLHVESVVIAVTPSQSKPDRGLVSLQSDTFNQNGELAQKLVSKCLLFRKPGRE